MKLGLLIGLTAYWLISLGLFTIGGSPLSNDYSLDNVESGFNTSTLNPSEVDTGGFFSTGVSFTRIFSFSSFGVSGNPNDPEFFILLLALWQTFILLITIVGLILSAVWNG